MGENLSSEHGGDLGLGGWDAAVTVSEGLMISPGLGFSAPVGGGREAALPPLLVESWSLDPHPGSIALRGPSELPGVSAAPVCSPPLHGVKADAGPVLLLRLLSQVGPVRRSVSSQQPFLPGGHADA